MSQSKWIVVLVAAVIFFGCIFPPPALMDDVDAVHAQMARNMLVSGDWVTALLDGVKYLEKSPLVYYIVFGVHAWAARIPIALFAVLLCWLTARMGVWAFSERAGMYAGLALATCVGLFLFTRILIPDVILTFSIALGIAAILVEVWGFPASGHISNALTQLSLGHMGDLTLASFAYLRTPLIMAGVASVIGATAVLWRNPQIAYVAMMVLFLHAARVAMIRFDPYLSSKARAGTLIEDNAYYTFSSVFFYANREGLLLNGRRTNLEYGSYAPDAPRVFIEDSDLAAWWAKPARYYLLVEGASMARIEKLAPKPSLHVVAESGGKYLLSNHADFD